MRGEPVELFITTQEFWATTANIGTVGIGILLALGLGVLGIGLIWKLAMKWFGD